MSAPELYEALDTILRRAIQYKLQAERAGRPSQAQWRGIEQVAAEALAKARGLEPVSAVSSKASIPNAACVGCFEDAPVNAEGFCEQCASLREAYEA